MQKHCRFGGSEFSELEQIDKETMQSQDFINRLNNYITSQDSAIDTSGWCEWTKGENGYPILNFSKKWNGAEWLNS